MGHRLHNAALPGDVNRDLYGRCNNLNGHGHEYTLEVTFAGSVDPATGFSVDLDRVDDVLRREIVERFDHFDFNRDLPEYRDVISSGENLARLFWELLQPRFAPHRLVRLRLQETEKNAFEYFGESPAIPGARINEEHG